MSQIRSRKRSPSAPLLALLAALPAAGLAQQENTLPTTTVKEALEVPYKADTSANPKYTQPLLNTPKTIQVIKKETLEEQGAITLMEALRNTPGITMQLGEGGNTSAGDTFQLRGAAMQQSIYVDGIRDLGAVTRDTFNLDQVEVIKGAAGAETGRNASTGYINLISKQAHLGDESSASATVGTASKKRGTVDLNRQLSDTSAVRINLMGQDSGVDGRDTVNNKGQGLGLAFAEGLGTATRLHLYSQHIRQNNVPDGGFPAIGYPGYYRAASATATPPISQAQADAMNAGAKVDRNNFYGSPGDYEKVEADMITAKLEHDLGTGGTVRNITRWGRTRMQRVLTGVGNVTAPAATVNDPSTWTVALSRQGVDRTNIIAANQTSMNKEFDAFGLRHSLVTGVELMREQQESDGFTSGTGTSYLYSAQPVTALTDPTRSGALSTGQMQTLAAYVSDTAKINDRYSVFASSRVDRYKLQTYNISATNVVTDLADQRNLLSWSLGGVYKPAPNGSIYTSYADSKTPPGGSDFQLSSTATNANNSALRPQVTRTAELGSKWELLDKRLNLSGALFRSVNDGQVSYDAITLAMTQFGKTQVQGLELSAVGQLTRFWQVTAGMARTSTKQLDQRSSTGTVSDAVRWSPDLTATIWTSYQLGQTTLGLGSRYVSEQKRLITPDSSAATTNIPYIPSSTVFDAMASYQLNPRTSLRLNVYNLFDRDYIATANNNGNRLVIGAPRSATLTATYKF